MLFNSISFLVFFPFTTLIYFLLPHKFRWLFLLLASSYFYIHFVPVYILVLIVLILLDYTMAILIKKYPGKKKLFLIFSLIGNIGLLAFFKYFNSANLYLGELFRGLGYSYQFSSITLLLPLGLSFHTFQSMSYIIEVYKGRQKVQKDIGIYSLYVMFYPQLVSGPIERPQNLMHQFFTKHQFKYYRIVYGLRLMLWGLFKKIVIADNLAAFVNNVYQYPRAYSGEVLILATLFFSIQIYCDFSGYSDIAIGAAKVLGFKLTKNFDNPYFATSIEKFWRRWHISLTSWFRDYVYIPLGGSRNKESRTYINLLIVFLISGAWHGSGATFLIWGFLHGTALVLHRVFVKNKRQILKLFPFGKSIFRRRFSIIITFSYVTFAWIFFRASNLQDALYISGTVFMYPVVLIYNLTQAGFSEIANVTYKSTINFTTTNFLVALFFSLLIWYLHFFGKIKNFVSLTSKKHKLLRWAVYSLLVLSILNFGQRNETPFIYFQF